MDLQEQLYKSNARRHYLREAVHDDALAGLSSKQRPDCAPLLLVHASGKIPAQTGTGQKSVADIFEGLRAEAVFELLEIEACGGDGFAGGFDDALLEGDGFRAVIGGLGWVDFFAAVADGPVQGAGGKMDGEGLCGAVPDDRPGDGPAVSGAHHAAVHQVDAAAGDFAVIDEEAGGPALMGLDVAVAGEMAVQDDDGSLLFGLGNHVEDVVADTRDLVEEDLLAVGFEL